MKMKIQIKTDSYNERRYSRPYIAIVDFKTNPKGDCTWGDWVGSPGENGILVIEAKPNDIIMKGQKDNRGRGSAPEYGMVEADSTIEWCENKAEAYALSMALVEHQAKEATPPSHEDAIESGEGNRPDLTENEQPDWTLD